MTDIYVLDTNIISALVNLSVPDMMTSSLIHRVQAHQQSSLIICECVLYEIERGLTHNQSKNKLSRFYTSILPLFQVTPIILVDWKSAGVLWASARAKGRQLSDIDLLVASVALRLSGVVVTDDHDFDILPVTTENWLHP